MQEFFYPVMTAGASLPYDGMTNYGGANKNASMRPGGGRVGPMTHDDAATGVQYTGFGPAYQTFNVDWPAPMVSYNGVLTLGLRHSADGTYFAQRKLYMSNVSGTLGTARYDSGLVGGGWATAGPSDISNAATYRGGGGTWVLADFQSAIIQFIAVSINTGDGAATGYMSSVWGEISFTAPGGGFVFLLGLAGLSALPFVGAMSDFAHFRRYIDWRTLSHPRGTKWDNEEEVQTAWRDVQAYRYPTHFLPA